MTARFGRNKRRAAREAVAEAMKLADNAMELARLKDAHAQQERRKADHYKREIDEVCEHIVSMLGRDTVLIPLSRHEVRDFREVQYARRWHIPPKLMVQAYDRGFSPVDMQEVAVDLIRTIVKIREPAMKRYLDLFERQIIVLDSNRTGEFEERGIGISIPLYRERGRKLTEQEIEWMLEPTFKRLKHELMEYANPPPKSEIDR
jgi:hypothetical protein